jgi:competence ComEA-like helix-hairpin-helix protein
MFVLERSERVVIIFLAITLLIGLGASAYKKSRPPGEMTVDRLSFNDRSRPDAGARQKININKAGVAELMRLKGVGKTLAGRITEYRKLHGSFIFTGDIMRVRGIGRALFEKIKDDIITE